MFRIDEGIMYKISVIVPVFNVENKIMNAFNSILNQTIGFENLEVIFVDDNSTDDSKNIIKSLENKYDNVKSFFLSKNSGYAGKPRNIGIKNATANYLMFLDPDDLYFEDACEKLYDEITESGCDFVSGNYISYFNQEEIFRSFNDFYALDMINDKIIVNSIHDYPKLLAIPPSVWSKIFNKEFIINNDLEFPVGIPGQDLVFVDASFLKANSIGFVDVPIVKYAPGVDEKKNTSVTSVRNKNLLSGYIKAYLMVYDLFKDYEDLVRYAVSNLYYWTEQFSISHLSKFEKLEILKFAYPLFEAFNNLGLSPRKELQIFFERVFEKDFVGAIESTERIAFNLIQNETNLQDHIMTRNFILILNNGHIDVNIFKLAQLLKKNNYKLTIVNFDGLNSIEDVFSDFENVINIYEYYSDGNNVKLMINDDEILLHDVENNFNLSFDDFNELKNYFLTELCLKFNEKIFLIHENLIELNIDSNLAYMLDISDERFNFSFLDDSLDNIDFNNCENIFKEIYKEDVNSKYEHQDYLDELPLKLERLSKKNEKLNNKIKKLKNRNDKLKNKNAKLINKNEKLKSKKDKLVEKNKKLNDLVSEFKSRKVIKVVDTLKKI